MSDGLERSLLSAHRSLRRGPVSEEGWSQLVANYRDSSGVGWRSLFYLHPDVTAIGGAPLVYQLHAIIAWLFWASFPFSRLVHAWSIPLQYLGRPYILYRRRYSTAR